MNTEKYHERVLPFIDAAAVCLAYYLAFLLRFEFAIPQLEMDNFVRTVPLVVVARLAVYWRLQLYSSLYRYAGFADLVNIVKAVLFSQVLIIAAALFMQHGQQFPRSVFVIDPVLAAIFAALPRFARRLKRELAPAPLDAGGPSKKMLIFGAGDLGESVVRNLKLM
ncbi:MAG TPA: hypothetical protein PLL10_07740, partial [Elusimicrobiales bacterium]|nr:hypothetical protein [Elusimicrobiales bacterium]